jgi:hypothetical protein
LRRGASFLRLLWLRPAFFVMSTVAVPVTVFAGWLVCSQFIHNAEERRPVMRAGS